MSLRFQWPRRRPAADAEHNAQTCPHKRFRARRAIRSLFGSLSERVADISSRTVTWRAGIFNSTRPPRRRLGLQTLEIFITPIQRKRYYNHSCSCITYSCATVENNFSRMGKIKVPRFELGSQRIGFDRFPRNSRQPQYLSFPDRFYRFLSRKRLKKRGGCV